MEPNPLKEGELTENSTGTGGPTRKMVRQRAVKIAQTNGRSAQNVAESDWEQARRELTGQPAVDAQTEILEGAPESQRWDPVAGSPGHKTAVVAGEDEDAEGRSDNEKLVEEGMAEAERDHENQAERDAARRG